MQKFPLGKRAGDSYVSWTCLGMTTPVRCIVTELATPYTCLRRGGWF